MAESSRVSPAAIALNRFGLGARADEAPPAEARRWLARQIDDGMYEARPPAWAAQPSSAALGVVFARGRAAIREARGDDGQAVRKAVRLEIRDTYRQAVDARMLSALRTATPFVERLVHFWANHFAVSVEKPAVAVFAGSFEAEAIRPHVLGRFEDMLVAAERHPAMQVFLDQPRSVGPDSPGVRLAVLRQPRRKPGLNENLGREIMELHTLGVRSGYDQEDVTEFARALTGWSIGALGNGGALANAGVRGNSGAFANAGAPGNSGAVGSGGVFGDGGALANASAARGVDAAAPGQFVFRARLHEPGERTIMGRRYDQPGEQQALAVLHDLAASPATARHIAQKLARHFCADNPPPALVSRLAGAFTDSDGDLPSVYRVLIDSPEPWSPAAVKFKTPWDWTVSAMRGLGRVDLGGFQAAPLLTQLGQPVWRPGSPAGYDDIAASWAAPDALVRRVELAQRLAAASADTVDARTLGPRLFAGSLAPATLTELSRAESASTALALLLVSPDFQRR